jgi:hypothetical protein
MIVVDDRQHIVLRAFGSGIVKASFIQGDDPEAPRFFLEIDVLPDDRPEEEGLHRLQQDQLVASLGS